MKRNIIFGILYTIGLVIIIISGYRLDYMTFVIAGYGLWVVFVIHLFSLGLKVKKECTGIESRIEN